MLVVLCSCKSVDGFAQPLSNDLLLSAHSHRVRICPAAKHVAPVGKCDICALQAATTRRYISKRLGVEYLVPDWEYLDSGMQIPKYSEQEVLKLRPQINYQWGRSPDELDEPLWRVEKSDPDAHSRRELAQRGYGSDYEAPGEYIEAALARPRRRAAVDLRLEAADEADRVRLRAMRKPQVLHLCPDCANTLRSLQQVALDTCLQSRGGLNQGKVAHVPNEQHTNHPVAAEDPNRPREGPSPEAGGDVSAQG